MIKDIENYIKSCADMPSRAKRALGGSSSLKAVAKQENGWDENINKVPRGNRFKRRFRHDQLHVRLYLCTLPTAVAMT